MRLLLSVILVVIPSFASKEHVPLKTAPDEEKNLLIELMKRLGKNSDYDLGWRDRAQSPRCAVSTNMSSIIKRFDSEKNGATFLKLHEDIETNEACSDLCCINKSCDLAVYENKGEKHCYLFQCKGKCLFGHHSSYISNTIARPGPQQEQQPPPAVADGSELDLMDLDDSPNTVGSHRDSSFHPPTTPVSVTLAPTSAPYIRAHSVGLEGPHCERDLHCEDPNAVCNYHRCRCGEGYYQKGHICRKNCGPSDFGCLELGTLGRGPQCVSVSQVCDSVMQCADGSDEFNCPDTGSDTGRLGGNAKEKPDTPSKADTKAPAQDDGDSSAEESKSSAQGALSPTKTDDNNNNPSSDDGVAAESQEKTGEEEEDRKTTPAAKTAGFPAAKAASDLAQGNGLPGQAAGFGKGGQTGDLMGGQTEDLMGDQTAFISKVKLGLPTEPANMQGPIIALALGLAFTLILLVFVACRLRTVRRRLRKGRPLHSNEADYLINGMYL